MIKASLFREAFAQKKSFVGRYMVLWIREGEDAALRLGLVSSKKVSLRAVDRNRARRRLREAVRRNRHRMTGPVDLLIIARRTILRASHSDVEQEFLYLARKAGIADRPEEPGK
jgi:ribonuclease P protein component